MIARVFPRRTKATPKDALAFTGPPGLFPPKVDEVHVSVTFTWDLPEAERLAKEWERIAPVKIGGPATGMRGEDFIPGMYLSSGHTITSRGCVNKCWFCEVWRRDGAIRELPVMDGWIVTDDNILATSREHFSQVMEMLKHQKQPACFRGGLEARLLTEWHAKQLLGIRTGELYFAYDTPDDLIPLRRAKELLLDVGFKGKGHKFLAYVLCGYKNDTIKAAHKRMWETISAGFMPYVMLWRGHDGKVNPEWRRGMRVWARPQYVGARIKMGEPYEAAQDHGLPEVRNAG